MRALQGGDFEIGPENLNTLPRQEAAALVHWMDLTERSRQPERLLWE